VEAGQVLVLLRGGWERVVMLARLFHGLLRLNSELLTDTGSTTGSAPGR
jgi:hypothetical protein